MINIEKVREQLLSCIEQSDNPSEVLRAPELKALYGEIVQQPEKERAAFGRQVNQLKQEIAQKINDRKAIIERVELAPIDVTAPMDVNANLPDFLPSKNGSTHPLMNEIGTLSGIFERMGFVIEQSREIDDQFNMFEALNFPAGHPARDDYDTFMTVEKDSDGHSLIAPAHTSTMQNRILRKYSDNLKDNQPIAVVVPDRVFRNEDLDAHHEHTFYQFEGIYVTKNVHAGMLVATLQEFLQQYYGKELEVRVNPFYFPFTEPSFEFSIRSPYSDAKDDDWIELLGCGMIHPNVLRAAGIDPTVYTGFAWGGGVDRLVMMKYGIEDVRYFHSGKLEFLRQF